MSLEKKGTIAFSIKHDHPDWATNDQSYNFGPFDTGLGLAVRAVKHPDKTLEISVAGPMGMTHAFRGPMPAVGPRGTMVGVTWKDNELKLYLNGKLGHTATIPQEGDDEQGGGKAPEKPG